MDLLGSIPSGSIMESLLEINGKYSNGFLSISYQNPFPKSIAHAPASSWHQLLRVPLSTRIRNLHKMLLELPGQIPSHFFIKSVLKSMENALGACWGVSSWSLIKSLPKSMQNAHGASWVRSFSPPPLINPH